uniref:Prolyl endopeptidase n=1 Tax=Strongyloides venezuelensis TaxID=75913 RepID=A0A0K0F4H0_STRVS
MYLKFLVFYIIALVAFLPYLPIDAKKPKKSEKAVDKVDEKDVSKQKGKKKGEKEKKGKKKVSHTSVHVHIHKLPPHCAPIKPKPPSHKKTTTGLLTTTKTKKPPKPGKPSKPSKPKTTTGLPTTTKTKKPPKPGKPSKPSKPKTTTGSPTTTKTKKPQKPGKPSKPSKPKTTTGLPTTTKTKKPTKPGKPSKPSKTTTGLPTTTKTKKPTKPGKPSKPSTKPPKPPVKPPVQPPKTTRPPSGGRTTTRRTKRTKTPPRTTTPKHNECDDWRDYYYERYHTTIRINVTEYYQAERCKKQCSYKIFGKEVYDYYQDLESLKNIKTSKFVTKLNSMSYKYLSTITIRNYIERKIKSFSSYTKLGIFEKYGQYVYYRYRESSQHRDSIWRRDGYLGAGKVFLDINKIDSTGKKIITKYVFSKDQKYMAYILCTNGDSLCTIKFKETEKSFKKINDELKYVYSRSMSFAYGTKGFFYSAYADKNGKIVSSLTSTKGIYHTLFYHRFGTKQEKDILIDADYDKSNVYVDGWVSPDGNMLFVKYSIEDRAHDPLQSIKFLRLYKLSESKIVKKIQLQSLFTKYDAQYTIVDSSYDQAILLTTKNAPNGRVVKINLVTASQGEKKWKEIIKGDKKKVFKTITAVGQKYLYVNYIENVTNKAFLYDKENGKMLTELDFEQSYSVEFSGSIYTSRFFIRVMNQAVPQIIYTGNTLDLKKISKKRPFKLRVVERTEISGIEKKDYVIKTIYYPSFDKTMVPLFIFHRKGIKLDGQNPLLLESYGAFGSSFFPAYCPSNLMFVTHFNGIYVVAGVRGGGEYGEEWHKDGSLLNKNNTFRDFISASEFLIKKNYTRPAKLVIRGHEEGGLLAAVVSRMRPDLFGSVIMRSPLLDMIRYPKLNLGVSRLAEFGNPEKNDFNYLIRYSPYHSIKMPKRPVQWPCTLISTSLANSKEEVNAAHTLKYTAELYYVLRKDGIIYQRNPVLVSVNEEVKQTTTEIQKQKVKTIVDEFSFVKETLNIKWRYSS